MPEFVVRTATRDEIDLIVDWAADEGWNPGHNDPDPFHIADPEGYLIGLVDGEPVACISVITFGEDFSFLGFYICRPEFRGRGYGMAIWNAGIKRLGNRTIGLDGVVDQQKNYAKSGFKLAHRNIRYGGIPCGDSISSKNIVDLFQDGEGDLDAAVLDYDRGFFPGPRQTFLKVWIAPPHHTLAYVEESAVRGYGTIRTCRKGYKVGPLFADNETIADALLGALILRCEGQEIFLDVPEPNAAAIALAKRYGLSPVFETARMYRGQSPTLPLDRIFGITTFELG